MSSHLEVIRVHNGIDIESELIVAAKRECDTLDLDTTAPFKRFPPGKNCVKVIDSLQKQVRKRVKSVNTIEA